MIIPAKYLRISISAACILAIPVLGFSESPTQNRGVMNSQVIPEHKKFSAKTGQFDAAPAGRSLSEPTYENLSDAKAVARLYRQQGVDLQRVGDLGGALSYYQKAIELDHFYAVPFNDMGVIFEAEGDIERAKENYNRSIEIDPNYLSAYSNLALLYETQRDLAKAELNWEKRAKLGLPDDPWTQKAMQRLNDIRLVLGKLDTAQEMKENAVMDFVKDAAVHKDILREDDHAYAQMQLAKAKVFYKKGELTLALKEANTALQLDQNNVEIDAFIRKVQRRLLTR